MSVVVSEHTRTRGEGKCASCRLPITPGETYRRCLAIQEGDWAPSDWWLQTVHASCVYGEPLWELRDSESSKSRDAQLVYVRKRYGSWYRVGVQVRIAQRTESNKTGEIVGGDGKYVRVSTKDNQRGGLYHADEVLRMAS